MVGDDHQRPRAVRGIDAARRVGQQDDAGPESPEQQHRLDDEPGVEALVEVEPALEGDDRDAGQSSEDEPAVVARGGRGGPARQLVDGDRRRVLDLVGEGAEPRAEHDPDHRDEVRASADGGLERVEPGGLVGRGDGPRGVEVGHRRGYGRSSVVAADRRSAGRRPWAAPSRRAPQRGGR